MSYFPITPQDRAEMLEVIGIEHEGQLFQAVPEALRNPKIDLPPALSELEAQSWFSDLAKQNASIKSHPSFLGAGCYEHFIPSRIRHLLQRGEFYTSYTPYQPEASQGTLQALFEYQSFICELTGMDVSNGSHYDGSTALAESVLMGFQETKRKKVLIAGSVHPEYRRVVETYLKGTEYSVEEFSFENNFSLGLADLKSKLSDQIAAVVVQSPNFFGLVEDLTEIEKTIHQNGSLLIMVSHPLSFGLYRTPKEWNADIVCGEGQPLGIAPSYGGPWLGFIASKRNLMRRIPGRLVGLTQDSEGKRAFCLTLQAREQHIRRERASSNICTNQALCAIAAAIYLASIGKTGLVRIAELNMENAYTLREELSKIKGVKILTQGAIFNEFVIELPKKAADVNEVLFQKKGIIGGFDLGRFYKGRSNQMLLCATETKTQDDLKHFSAALAEVLK